MNTTETQSATLPASVLTKQQYTSMGPRAVSGYGPGAALWVHMRHDDECGNGHNTFAITGTVRVPRQKEEAAFGCLHDEIARVFPEYAPLLKWHLTSTDGPMHYAANTVFLAGDRDYHGHRAGEASSFERVIRWNGFPIEWRGGSNFVKWCEQMGARFVAGCEVFPVQHGPDTYKFKPKFTLGGFDGIRWHECPFDTEREALQFVAAAKLGFTVEQVAKDWSEGKARELPKARGAAVWPDATDEQLSAEPDVLRAALAARLPGLMAEFKTAVESVGFIY